MGIEKRRFSRVFFKGALVAHNNRRIYNGACNDISVMGLSFTTEKEYAIPVRSKITIHVKSGSIIPSFNAVCEIISVQQVAHPKSPEIKLLVYRLKFLSISKEAQEAIQLYTKNQNHSQAA